ncbi:MAG: metal-dependent transcriptional regulator [bacterium]
MRFGWRRKHQIRQGRAVCGDGGKGYRWQGESSVSQQQVDEILEIIWMKKEQGENDLCVVEAEIEQEKLANVLKPMEEAGLILIKGKDLLLTENGEQAARGLIRRHRLAERLLTDILDAGKDNIEEPACQFEHLVSDEVTEAICTLLGHPTVCPHGLPIPEGRCCVAARQQVESLIVPLNKVEMGEWVTVAYVLAHNHPRLHKLMSFGITPGVRVKMHQKSPTFVIQVEETQIALEEDIVKDIFVRR